ncbi:galactokinase [bacterium]|nr:galactokinase [bacterium]
MPSSPDLSRSYTVIAPGRVNLLGEHVDYNDGPVLPVAIDLTMTMTFSALAEDLVQLQAIDLNENTSFQLDELADKVDLNGKSLSHAALYPASVAWACQQAGLSVPGLRASYTSNIPIGAGLSSSAAVEMAFIQAFRTLGGWDVDRMDLVKWAQKGENDFVGVNSGIMDQFACLFGVKDHALYLDTHTLEWEPVPLPKDVAIIVADSHVPRKLADSAYNDRQAACQQAVRELKAFMPEIQSLRDVSPAQFERYADKLSEVIGQRARHVVEEIARVEKSVRLLKSGDVAGFGELMVAGHASLRDLYEVSTPELDALVEIALAQPGCYGARLTGAGFGGCTVNLVREEDAPAFLQAVEKAYLEKTGKRASLYHCHATRGAHVVG